MKIYHWTLLSWKDDKHNDQTAGYKANGLKVLPSYARQDDNLYTSSKLQIDNWQLTVDN